MALYRLGLAVNLDERNESSREGVLWRVYIVVSARAKKDRESRAGMYNSRRWRGDLTPARKAAVPDSIAGVPGQESKTNTVPDGASFMDDAGRPRRRVVRFKHPLH